MHRDYMTCLALVCEPCTIMGLTEVLLSILSGKTQRFCAQGFTSVTRGQSCEIYEKGNVWSLEREKPKGSSGFAICRSFRKRRICRKLVNDHKKALYAWLTNNRLLTIRCSTYENAYEKKFDFFKNRKHLTPVNSTSPSLTWQATRTHNTDNETLVRYLITLLNSIW